jgi:aspartyl-tRNA(Asn)/glutamyl-tRNA(Gln) amidotransferase subunit C
MSFLKEELSVVEALAKLQLMPEEKERCYQAFADALALADTLCQVPTQGVEPMVSPLDIVNVMRADEVLPSLDRDKVMALSAETEDGCFKVPRIL